MTLEELVAAIKGGNVDKALDIGAVVQEAIDAQASAVAGLKQKNTKLTATNTAMQKSAAAVPEGFDPELWATLLEEHENEADNKLKAEGKWNELKEQLQGQHAKELEKRDTLAATLRTALSTQLVDNAAVAAITAAKGNSALLLPHVKASLQMTQGDDGTFAAIVADTSGEARFSKLKAGEQMGIEELVNEFKADKMFAAAFAAENSGGGASGGDGAGFSGKNPFVKGKDLNYTEQAKLNRSDPALAAQMKASAEAA